MARLVFTNGSAQAPGTFTAQYALPARQDEKAVRTWYDTALPAGHAWRTWQPCTPSGVKIDSEPASLLQRSWSQGAAVLVLTVEKRRGALQVLMLRDPHGHDGGGALTCWS
jgi:hypothetical protein